MGSGSSRARSAPRLRTRSSVRAASRAASARSWPPGFGIPAMVHEECLTGLAAWQATGYPSPLRCGASFDPELAERMGPQIGRAMRRLGVGVIVGRVQALDLREQPLVLDNPSRSGAAGTLVVRGRRHVQGPADRLDAEAAAVLVDEADHFGRYASSSVAKTPTRP
jgi:hypothetical protein